MKTRLLLVLLMIATAAFADMTVKPAGAPPAEVAASIKAALQPEGIQVVGADGSPYCNLWFVKEIGAGEGVKEMGVSLQSIPLGSLVGVVQFPKGGEERRGQKLEPGTYTLRYELYPVDGAHQGIALQRDFLILTPAADDQDLNARPKFDELMQWSRKASKTPHPASLELWKDDNPGGGPIEKLGEDWVLHFKVGKEAAAMVVFGKTAH